jgi:hypothetical protein
MKTRDELKAILGHFWELRRTQTEGVAAYYLQSTLWPLATEAIIVCRARVLRNDARDCRTMDIDAITDARKAEILRLLDQGVDFDRPTRLFLAEKYSCSEATIVADIELLRRLRVIADSSNQGQSLS